MKAREGDLIETFDNNIFDVKGSVHPPRKIIAFIRFTPNPKGDRKKGKVAYQKVYPLRERYELLQERFPQYLVYDQVFDEWLCEVPISAIRHHHKPQQYLLKLRQRRKLTPLEAAALNFAGLLKETSGVSWNKLGVSGSLLVRLYTPNSDIDLIVYGSRNCRRVYDSLKTLVNDRGSQIKAYNKEKLKRLFDFRSKDTAMSFENFVRTESRKVLQGTFLGYDYFIRCVKDWNEINEQYGAVHYQSVGYSRIRAMVADDSQMIFTPCHYKVGNIESIDDQGFEPIHELVSFRGRFCEQARRGETVIAQGKLERVHKKDHGVYYRLLLGNKVADHMILMEKEV